MSEIVQGVSPRPRQETADWGDSNVYIVYNKSDS